MIKNRTLKESIDGTLEVTFSKLKIEKDNSSQMIMLSSFVTFLGRVLDFEFHYVLEKASELPNVVGDAFSSSFSSFSF